MASARGLLAYGAYVPYARLDRKSIGEALGASAGSGTRAVASYDEDTTSMGVEAARATTLEECADLMAQSFTRPAPFLVDLAI